MTVHLTLMVEENGKNIKNDTVVYISTPCDVHQLFIGPYSMFGQFDLIKFENVTNPGSELMMDNDTIIAYVKHADKEKYRRVF